MRNQIKQNCSVINLYLPKYKARAPQHTLFRCVPVTLHSLEEKRQLGCKAVLKPQHTSLTRTKKGSGIREEGNSGEFLSS